MILPLEKKDWRPKRKYNSTGAAWDETLEAMSEGDTFVVTPDVIKSVYEWEPCTTPDSFFPHLQLHNAESTIRNRAKKCGRRVKIRKEGPIAIRVYCLGDL